MLLELAKAKKILFFGGKGGVGKTTVSAVTATACAELGEKVLLISTDPAHNLGHLFGRKIGSKPTRITAGLDALELDPHEIVNLHLKEISSALHRLMPSNLLSMSPLRKMLLACTRQLCWSEWRTSSKTG